MYGVGAMVRAAVRNIERSIPKPRFRRSGEYSNGGKPQRLIAADLRPGTSRLGRVRAERARSSLAWAWAIIVVAAAALVLLVTGAV